MSSSGQMRLFTGQFKVWLESINYYGCWCYFGLDHGKGKSQPVDELDELCKKLHDAYECIMMDDPTCVAWDIDYTLPSAMQLLYATPDQVPSLCASSNPGNDCHIKACTVEQNFVKEQQVWQVKFIADMAKYGHNNGAFDVDVECPVTAGPVSDKSCCGEYPARYPYRLKDSVGDDTRGCCGSEVYNHQVYSCCSDVITMGGC